MQSFVCHDVIRLAEISDGSTVILMPLLKTNAQMLQQAAPQALPVNMVQSKSFETVPVQKKIVAPEQKKKAPVNKPPQKKVIPQKEKKPVQNLQKKVPLAPKKDAKKVPLKKIEKPQASPQKIPTVPLPKELLPTQSELNALAQPVEIGRNDLEFIKLCNEIKDGIAQTWRRPANISSAVACHVTVCIHSETNRDVTIMQSSQALALDIMVKNFVLHYPFPPTIWHKELELIF